MAAEGNSGQGGKQNRGAPHREAPPNGEQKRPYRYKPTRICAGRRILFTAAFTQGAPTCTVITPMGALSAMGMCIVQWHLHRNVTNWGEGGTSETSMFVCGKHNPLREVFSVFSAFLVLVNRLPSLFFSLRKMILGDNFGRKVAWPPWSPCSYAYDRWEHFDKRRRPFG